VKPGYTDTAAVAGSPIVEVDPSAATSDTDKKSSKKKKKADSEDAGKPGGE